MIETNLTEKQLETLYYSLTVKLGEADYTNENYDWRKYFRLSAIRTRISLEEYRRLHQRHKEWNYE